MFEAIGHPVQKLRRIRIGFLGDETLRSGDWRHLTRGEVQRFYREFAPLGKDRPVRATPRARTLGS